MSRFRFRMRTLLALPLVVGLVTAFFVRSCYTLIADGIPANVLLTFLILDDSGHNPICSASVHIPKPICMTKAALSATTDAEGRARILFDTQASEAHNPYHRVSRHVSYGGELHVSAAGYLPRRILLSELTMSSPYHYDETPPPIVIRLRKW